MPVRHPSVWVIVGVQGDLLVLMCCQSLVCILRGLSS
jgi:hypothetical protein